MIRDWRFQLAVMVLCGCLLQVYLVSRYVPSMASLNRTTEISGLVYFTDGGNGPPEVDGVVLMCRMDFLAANEGCVRRVPALREGASVRVAIADIPTTLNDVQLVTSVTSNGHVVYARTPEQIVHEYMRSSFTGALAVPCAVLMILLVSLCVTAFRPSS